MTEPREGSAVPAVLKGARFVPRQSPGRRQPARVTPGAFRAAGLPVPENPAQQNAYQLSGRQGVPWSPAIDRHIARRGGEVLGRDDLILIDIDLPAGPDGLPSIDALRWLSDRAVEAGEFLDMAATLTVRTPGHPDARHLPGWHLWYAAAGQAVRMGPLARCRFVELRNRGTCPGSPGYAIRSNPAALPVLPPWLAALAGAPLPPPVLRPGASGASPESRLHGIIDTLLGAGPGERNRLLFWASARTGELVTEGALDQAAAEKMLGDAAAEIGLVAEDGEGAVAGTITSGLRQAVRG